MSFVSLAWKCVSVFCAFEEWILQRLGLRHAIWAQCTLNAFCWCLFVAGMQWQHVLWPSRPMPYACLCRLWHITLGDFDVKMHVAAYAILCSGYSRVCFIMQGWTLTKVWASQIVARVAWLHLSCSRTSSDPKLFWQAISLDLSRQAARWNSRCRRSITKDYGVCISSWPIVSFWLIRTRCT